MTTTPSLRRLWSIYKRTAQGRAIGASKRDLMLSQVTFYSGARSVEFAPQEFQRS